MAEKVSSSSPEKKERKKKPREPKTNGVTSESGHGPVVEKEKKKKEKKEKRVPEDSNSNKQPPPTQKKKQKRPPRQRKTAKKEEDDDDAGGDDKDADDADDALDTGANEGDGEEEEEKNVTNIAATVADGFVMGSKQGPVEVSTQAPLLVANNEMSFQKLLSSVSKVRSSGGGDDVDEPEEAYMAYFPKLADVVTRRMPPSSWQKHPMQLLSTQTIMINFSMQDVDTWRDTQAYSGGTPWSFDAPIQLPAVRQAIDIPLRLQFHGGFEPSVSIRNGGDIATRRCMVIVNQLECLKCTCENMYTDFSMVFCALKPVPAIARYPTGKSYGMDAALDRKLLLDLVLAPVTERRPKKGGEGEKKKTPAAAAAADDASKASSSKRPDAPTRDDTRAFDSLFAFYHSFAASDESVSVQSTGKRDRKQKSKVGDSAPVAAAASATPARRPVASRVRLNHTSSLRRYFDQEIFDSPFTDGNMPLRAIGDQPKATGKFRWLAHPTIPISTKPTREKKGEDKNKKGGGGRGRKPVFTRAEAVGIRLLNNHCSSDRIHMFHNSVVSRYHLMKTSSDKRFEPLRSVLEERLPVDLDYEAVTALGRYQAAVANEEAYTNEVVTWLLDASSTPAVAAAASSSSSAKAAAPAASSSASAASVPQVSTVVDSAISVQAADIKARIRDYTTYRLVIDTRRPFERFDCFTDQFVYMQHVTLAKQQARVEGASASPQKTVYMEGPYIVISVTRYFLFAMMRDLLREAQAESVDLNTAHLTLIPHRPMKTVGEHTTASANATNVSLPPKISVDVLVTYTQISCD